MFGRKILVIAFFIILGILGGIFFVIKNFSEEEKLTKLLEDVSIPKIEVGAKEYSIKNGRVEQKVNVFTSVKILRLVAFYQWNKEDPIFYSPDLNIKKIYNSVLKTEESQKKLFAALKTKDRIYPIDFLKSFTETASITQNFFLRPSLEAAKMLSLKQSQTASVYKKDAQSLATLIRDKNKYTNKQLKSVVLFNVEESIETVVSDIDKLALNADVLLNELMKREKCLKGMSKCIRPSSNYVRPVLNLSTNDPVKNKFLDKKIIFYNKKQNELIVRGPYRAKTPCFGWGENYSYPKHYFYVRQDSGTIDIQLADETYFKKINSYTVNPLDRIFLQNGIDHRIVASSTLYMCTYSGNLAEISEMDTFLNENKPLFYTVNIDSKEPDSDFFKEANYVEEKVFNSTYPDYEDLKTLSSYYGYAYKLISHNNIFNYPNQIFKEELLRRKIVINAKLGDFYKILNYTNSIIDYSIQLEWTKPKGNIEYALLYPYRSYYSIMYMPFSDVVYRQTENLEYLDKTHVNNAVSLNGGYISYTQAITKYPMNEIAKWFNLKVALH